LTVYREVHDEVRPTRENLKRRNVSTYDQEKQLSLMRKRQIDYVRMRREAASAAAQFIEMEVDPF